MRCPNCNQPGFERFRPCPNCQSGNTARLSEELAHVNWLLAEVDAWQMLDSQAQQSVQQKYAAQKKQLEIELGLRLPPFTDQEAREAWPKLIRYETLLQNLAEWLGAGLLNPTSSQLMVDQTSQQVGELLEQLDGRPRPPLNPADTDQLNLTNFLLEATEHLSQNQGFITPEAEEQIRAPLLAQQEQLEIKLGLRPAPGRQPIVEEKSAEPVVIQERGAPTPQGAAYEAGLHTPPMKPYGRGAGEQGSGKESPIQNPKSKIQNGFIGGQSPEEQDGEAQPVKPVEPTTEPPPESGQPAIPPPAAPPKPAAPRIPFRKRLWQALLSERTLQAMLFLGIFLLFSAALSFVAWGWRDFSAPLRVAIPASFTGLFFALGWYVRTKTPMYRSGIALSAIAALLIPIDFYTVYVNFNISPNLWPLFWLVASVVCLIAYIIATLIIRNQIFGYLVGVAAGSSVLALIELENQVFGLSLDWRSSGLSALSLGLIILATTFTSLSKKGEQQSIFSIFAGPFRYLSLLTITVIMILTFGWRYYQRHSYDTLHYALAVNWWLGSFIFGWGAIQYRSRGLGLLAAITLPVATYLAQAAIFNRVGVNPAWHAFGWALLVPLYFIVGYKLLEHKEDPLIQSHGRTAVGWGVALLFIATFWSLTNLTNGAAAASSHAVLAGALVLVTLLWRQPIYLYGASILSFSAASFAMAELDLTVAQLSVGWASLAIAHIIMAVNVGTRFPIPVPKFAGPLVISGYLIAAAAILPTLFPYDGNLLAYALGNWLALTAWGARLAHLKQPGFVGRGLWRKPVFHWFTAASLPLWLWILLTNARPVDATLPLALAALAWGMVALSYRLTRAMPAYRWPWYLTGLLVSVVAIVSAVVVAGQSLAAGLTLLAVGLLYFVDAIFSRQPGELAPAGFVTAWGVVFLLNRLQLSVGAAGFGLALLITIYVLAGLWTERQKSPIFTRQFLAPLYITCHFLTLVLLAQIYIPVLNRIIFNVPWTDETRLWGAASQFLLAIIYGLYAWGTYKERWGYLAAWLVTAGSGFVVITYSTGQGSSAAKVVLGAITFVVAERSLHWLRQHSATRRRRVRIQLVWRLYRHPLLVAGWVISAAAIWLALVRNLWLLGGGQIQQIWAVVALLLIIGLYALAVLLFRQARFLWLAAPLTFAPWTILTHLGWFTAYRPTPAGYALSWALLAWVLLLISLVLARRAGGGYALPFKLTAHLLMPFSLLWGLANVDTARFTFGLAVAFYGLAAVLNHRRLEVTNRRFAGFAGFRKTKFFYPALGLIPVWCIYLMAWLLPMAQREHYGFMLLIFGPLGMATGQRLYRLAPQQTFASSYALPAYLTGYVSLAAGTALVVHELPLLAMVLLFDALLMLVSAWLFKRPIWVYAAVILAPLSLWLALPEANVPASRYGWWLIGLASIYLVLTYVLRRANLFAYSAAPLSAGLILIALSLAPSSLDQTGALWGYGSAALLYAIAALWLCQPVLTTPASGLAIVPYAIILKNSSLSPEYYGLALFPGAVMALALGWGLDYRFGAWQDFPWGKRSRWLVALIKRLLGWWAFPLYVVGFALATASPFFTLSNSGLIALNFFVMIALFGWATYRFRLRGWLVAAVVAGHFAVAYYLDVLDLWHYPNLTQAWLRFLPVTLFMGLVTLFIKHYRNETSPFDRQGSHKGWSYPLYIIMLFDLIIGQLLSFVGNGFFAASIITLTHTFLIAILASFWLSSRLAYFGIGFGVVTLTQWIAASNGSVQNLANALAQSALAFGLVGYSLAWIRNNLKKDQRLHPWLALWELPLQRFAISLSFGTLVLTSLSGLDLIGWLIRAIFSLPFRHIVDLATVQMVVGVFGFLGLLYLAAAFTHRRARLGYAAIGMLLTAWTLYLFFVQEFDNLKQIQEYVIPTGLYLLGISYLEWQDNNKTFARRLDYAAMVLMLGSLFWQTLLFGWGYALLLGAEGMAAFFWGSGRRLRRFLYAGMVGVILATIAQLLNSLRSINQWIVFGIIGLLLVLVAVVVERKLEDIKSWQEMLETWE